MENLFKLLEDIEVETEIVIDDLVMGIETLLDIMFITLQNGKESNQENLSGYKDSITLLLSKDKARVNTPQDLEFKNFMKTPVGIARVYKTPFMTKLRLLREDWERYMVCIIAW